MEWTEETPINLTNLNDLEDRITTANANVTAGKAAVAAAITAMGQASTGADTYAQMATKIQDISDDADAAVGEVLDTKTFYQGGAKKTGTMPNRGSVGIQNLTTEGQEYTIAAGYHNGLGKVKAVITNLIASVLKHGAVVGGITGTYDTEATVPIAATTVLVGKKGRVNGATITGTMPNRAGDTAAVSSHNSGTSIHIVPAAGFYDGSDDAAVITDADNVAANIKKDVNLFGLVGTYITPITAGDKLIWEHIYESGFLVSAGSIEYSIRINITGTYRTKFDMRHPSGAVSATGRIYKNGGAYGTLRTNATSTYITYTEDLAFTAGDSIDFYFAGNTVQYRNCGIYAAEGVEVL